MKCDKCQYVEMKMYKTTEDNKMIFRCKQCGNEKTVSMSEIETIVATKNEQDINVDA